METVQRLLSLGADVNGSAFVKAVQKFLSIAVDVDSSADEVCIEGVFYVVCRHCILCTENARSLFFLHS